jgi:hypothetical protein
MEKRKMNKPNDSGKTAPKSEGGTCVLSDGRRVKYTLKVRDDGPNYFVVFRNPACSGYRLERSTGESSKKRAHEAAAQVIAEAYLPQSPLQNMAWDEAIEKIKEQWKAQNLRPRTIDDYLAMIKCFRLAFPESRGPHDVTPEHASRFKILRSHETGSPVTVGGNLNKLSVIWEKWLKKKCKIVNVNPWEDIEKPKEDEPVPRYIEPAEEQGFFDWLLNRWDGWRLPVLFFTVKGLVGRRILQLASLPKDCLSKGRIVFHPETCKGRRIEHACVPPAIFKELKAQAGSRYLWERYSEQLASIYRKRKRRAYVKDFTPSRFKRWLQDEVTTYNNTLSDDPGYVPFTAHNFRDTAMTKAWDADIPPDKAAIAFGCHSETMKKHYIRKDKLAIADDVFARMQAKPGTTEETAPEIEMNGPDSPRK